MYRNITIVILSILLSNTIVYSSENNSDKGNGLPPAPKPIYETVYIKETDICSTLDSLLKGRIIPLMKKNYLKKENIINIYFTDNDYITVYIENKKRLINCPDITGYNDKYYYPIFLNGISKSKCSFSKSGKTKKHRFIKPGTNPYFEFYDPPFLRYRLINQDYELIDSLWYETQKNDIDPILFYAVTKIDNDNYSYKFSINSYESKNISPVNINVNRLK